MPIKTGVADEELLAATTTVPPAPEPVLVASMDDDELGLPGAKPVTDTALPISVTEPALAVDEELMPPATDRDEGVIRNTPDELPDPAFVVADPLIASEPAAIRAIGWLAPDAIPVAEDRVSCPPVASGAMND